MAQRPTLGGMLGLAIAASAFVSACGGAAATPSAAPASTAAPTPGIASAEPSTPPPATTEPSPSASAAIIVNLGEVGITPRGSRVTVHSFGPSDRSIEPPAGSAWHEADLEWCLPSTIVNPVTVGNLRYELVLELGDGSRIEPQTVADSPDEVYASEGSFKANECVRGALVFAVPTGSSPEHLLLVGGNGGMRWRLS